MFNAQCTKLKNTLQFFRYTSSIYEKKNGKQYKYGIKEIWKRFLPSISTQAGYGSSHFPLTHSMVSLPFRTYPGSQEYFTMRPSKSRNAWPCSGGNGMGHGAFGGTQYTKEDLDLRICYYHVFLAETDISIYVTCNQRQT